MIEKIQTKVTHYKTSDGRVFSTEELAKNHDAWLQKNAELKKYEIGKIENDTYIIDILYGLAPLRRVRDYAFYKINNMEEATLVANLISTPMYPVTLVSNGREFPIIFGYDNNTKDIIFLDVLMDRKLKFDTDYNEFINKICDFELKSKGVES